MITAEQARELIKCFIEKKSEEKLEAISSEIEKEAMAGEKSACYQDFLTDNNLEMSKIINQKLVEAGFTVKLDVQQDTETILFDINWSD